MFINKIKTAATLILLIFSMSLVGQDSYGKLLKQLRQLSVTDSVSGFDYNFHKASALNGGFVGTEFNVYMYNQMRGFVNTKYNLQTPLGYNLRPPSGGTNQVNAAPCVNEDFEASPNVPFTTVPQGGISAVPGGWVGNAGVNGTTINNTYWTSCNVANHPGITQVPNEIWVRQTPIADPNFPGGVPNSPLGGTKVIQLNDNLAQSGRISQIRQTFPVAATNALFQFAYAACFNGAGHLCCDQPFLNIKLKNCQNVLLTCPQVTVIAPGPSCVNGTPGFLTNGSGYLYKNWTVQSIDLTPYIGSCVTIEVTVGDCTGWAHFGYCYFDAVCKPITLQVNNNLFPAGSNAVVAAGCGTNTAVMVAPPGLGPYSWNGPTGPSNSQTLTTNVAGNYTLTMNPVGSCTPIVKTVSLSFGANPTSGFTQTNVCNNYTFTNTGSASPAIQTYSFIGVGAPVTYTTTSPTSSVTFPNPGTYTIQQIVTNTIGCTATTTAVVTIPVGPPLTVNSPSVCPNVGASLTVSGANTYLWSGPGLSNPNISNPVATTSATAIYTVTGTAPNGCSTTNTTQVTVLPTPTLTVGSLTMCVGSSSVLTVTGGSTYTWSPATGLSNPNISNPSANPTVTTIYTVATTATNGCQSSTTSTVGVSPLPILSVTSPSTCAGITTTVIASGATTYSWSTGSLTNSITPNPTVVTTYTVIGTSSVGCKSTATTQVLMTPPLQVVVGSNAPICQNGTLNLTSNIPGATWVWTGPSFTSSVQNPTVANAQPLSSGVYSVFVTNPQGCVGSASINVVVNALPNPQITSNSPVCQNTTLQFGGTGGVGYSWQGPNWSSSIQNPQILSSQVLNTGTYTLTVTDANGCVKSTTTSATVNPLPTVSVGGATVCSGVSATLTANGGVTYSWQGPNFTSNQQNPQFINCNTSMSGYYYVTVTDINGCVNNGNTYLQVFPPFTVQATNNSPICEGKTLILTGPANYGYIWSGPNGFTSNFISPLINDVTTSATGVYTLVAVDAGGCIGSTITNVIINPNPVVNIISNSDRKCTPSCVTFTLNSNQSLSNVNWMFQNSTLYTSNTVQICYNKGGIYTSTATVTDINGCIGKTTHSVEVYQTPVADFVFNPLVPIENDAVNFVDASYGSQLGNWYWFFNSTGLNSQTQNPMHVYTEQGAYPVTLIVETTKGCKDTITKVVNVKEGWAIWVPNVFTPNGDGVNDIFQPKGYGISKYRISIFDRWGEEVFTTTDFTKGWDGTVHKTSELFPICKDDVYTWLINLVNNQGKSHELKGHVTLIK